jgi:hypothetical protein
VRRILLAILIAVTSAPAQPPTGGEAVWKAVRDGLAGPHSSEFWESNIKDALLPGSLARAGWRGTVISSEPPDHPILLRLAMYGATMPEVTIKLPRPLKASYPSGTIVLFLGGATKFTRDPFMLTLEVEQDEHTFVEKQTK